MVVVVVFGYRWLVVASLLPRSCCRLVVAVRLACFTARMCDVGQMTSAAKLSCDRCARWNDGVKREKFNSTC